MAVAIISLLAADSRAAFAIQSADASPAPPQETPAASRASQGTGGSNTQKVKFIDLAPLVDMTHEMAEDARFIGGYTRFIAREAWTPAERAERIAKTYEEQRSLYNLFSSKTVSRVLTIKMTLSRPRITTTTNLANDTYDTSGGNGRTWTTELNSIRFLTPYIRIDPDSSASVEVSVNASKTASSDAAKTIVNILQQITKLGAPQGALVTSLNAERIDTATKVVDNALGRLFNMSLEERSKNDIGAPFWHPATRLAVEVKFPLSEKIIDQKHRAMIGKWIIQAEHPLVSIFNHVPICPDAPAGQNGQQPNTPQICDSQTHEESARQAFSTLSPATVLNFPVGENQTVADVLRADEAISPQLAIAQSSTDSARFDPEKARALCTSVSVKAEAIGFNRFDTAAILWALTESNMVSRNAAEELIKPEACPAARLWNRIKPAQEARLPAGNAPAASPAADQASAAPEGAGSPPAPGPENPDANPSAPAAAGDA